MDSSTLKNSGPLIGLTATLALSVAAFSGTGTAHAYTDSEAHYLIQLNEEQVPGESDIKLNDGYAACNHLRNGAQPWPELNAMSQSSGWTQEDAARVLVAATWWLCRDQNWKSDKAFSA
jgi:hypothetical protein